MTLTVGTDSYISVADADIYFGDVLFPEPWTTTDTATKEKALKMATKKIDAQNIMGRKFDTGQTLQFPRALYSNLDFKTVIRPYERLALRRDVYNLPGWVGETEVSQDVKNATCEEALALLKGGSKANKRAELQRQGVTSFSLGGLSESYSGVSSNPNKLLSVTAVQLLARYIGGSRSIL